MRIAPFETEDFYARYEFSSPHILSVSDCETVSIAELLTLAGRTLEDLGRTRLGYTESRGHPELRAAIAASYEHVDAEAVLELSAPIEGIYIAMEELLEPGDRAVVLGPCYDALHNIPAHVSGNVEYWMLEPVEGGWALDFDKLDALLKPPTKLLVVNFPQNPTGFLPTEAQFFQILERVREKGLWLFSDEMYRGLELDGVSMLPSAADHYERAIVLSGLSKTYGLPGLRFGWLVVRDQELYGNLLNWKYYTSICPPGPSETLAMAAFEARDKLVDRNSRRLHSNVALADNFFERHLGFFDWRRPQAGSIALVGVDVPSAKEYCHMLAEEAGIVLLPSSFLGYSDTHVRFGFGRDSFGASLGAYERYLAKGK